MYFFLFFCSGWGKKGGRDVMLPFYICIKNAVWFEKVKKSFLSCRNKIQSILELYFIILLYSV